MAYNKINIAFLIEWHGQLSSLGQNKQLGYVSIDNVS